MKSNELYKFVFISLLWIGLGSCDSNSGDVAPGLNKGGFQSLDPQVEPITSGAWFKPSTTTTWQWQLQGVLNTSYIVDVYDVDLFDTSATEIENLHVSGRKVICYFSEGSYESFRSDAGEFVENDKGNTLDGYEDERWLDIRSPNVMRIMKTRLDLAVQKGCDAVEPDNTDGLDNDSGFNYTANDQLAFIRTLANEAHNRGLGIGLKNTLSQIPDLIDFVDFQVNEQCHEYAECSELLPFIAAGKPVFNAEYLPLYAQDSTARNSLCAAAQIANIRTLVLPIDLDDSFRFSCD